MFQEQMDMHQAVQPKGDQTTGDRGVQIVPCLLSISKSSRALLGIRLAEIGFYNGQDETILALQPDEPVTVSALADKLAVRPSTVSKMLDRLVVRKLVERTADRRDLRRTVIRITPEGVKAQSQIRRIRDQMEAELTSDLGDEEIGALLRELKGLERHLTKRLMRLR